jgi:flagellar hook-associated protein 1 FlgK
MARLQTQNTLAAGTTSYQGAYSQMVSMVGNKTHQIEVTSQAQDTLTKQAALAQQSFSGVNLDEEAANLLRYQQAYQASGKVIQVASVLFQTVLDMAH